MRQRFRKLLVGLIVVGLLLGTASVAWAAEPEPDALAGRRRVVLRGEVTAIDGDALTVETRHGEITVLADDMTRFRIPEVEEPGLDDLTVGDRIAAEGRWVERGVLRARLILRIPDNARLLRGTVGEIGDDGLTLSTDDGEVNVLTDEKTRVFIPGVEEPTLADLETDAAVTVAGLEDENGNIVARAIRALTCPGGQCQGVEHTRGLAHGTITTVDADGFQLETPRGVLDFQVDATTFFINPRVEEPGLSDLTAGAKALVAWQKTEDGNLLAKMVAIVLKRR